MHLKIEYIRECDQIVVLQIDAQPPIVNVVSPENILELWKLSKPYGVVGCVIQAASLAKPNTVKALVDQDNYENVEIYFTQYLNKANEAFSNLVKDFFSKDKNELHSHFTHPV